MALLDKIFGLNKTLSDLSRTELRKEEIILSKQRDRLFKKIETFRRRKAENFSAGKGSEIPGRLRRALAVQFEMKTQEQMLNARELNCASKELMTVSRLRMIKENSEHGRGKGRLNLTDRDVARIGFMDRRRRGFAGCVYATPRHHPGPRRRVRQGVRRRADPGPAGAGIAQHLERNGSRHDERGSCFRRSGEGDPAEKRVAGKGNVTIAPGIFACAVSRDLI